MLTKLRSKIYYFLGSNKLVLIFGSSIVALWTLVRFMSKPPTFDLTGQQVLAHQWIGGMHAGSVVGPTNYLLKLIFLYVPLNSVPGSPLLKLVVLTLIINIFAFWIIAWLVRKFVEAYGKINKRSTNVALLYLATISGSVYWINFANSRNLEVAAGFGAIYLLTKPSGVISLKKVAALIILLSLLLFADPLQLYMTVLPAIALMFYLSRKISRVELKKLGCIAAGFFIAKALVDTFKHLWNVTLQSSPPIHSFSSLSLWGKNLTDMPKQIIRLYYGGSELGQLAQLINMLLFASVIGASIWCYIKKPASRTLLVLGWFIGSFDLVVYLASNQATQGDTSRYLIMTVPFFVIVFATVLQHLDYRRMLKLLAALAIFMNIVMMLVALHRYWDPSLHKYDHARNVAKLSQTDSNFSVYASIDGALLANYVGGRTDILPLGCQPDRSLRPATLFYDAAGFRNQKSKFEIVLDGANITNYPSLCDVSSISGELGPSDQTKKLSDGSTVLVYNHPNKLLAR